MTSYLDDLADFIHTYPTPYHVTAEVAARTTDAGFTIMDDALGSLPSAAGGYVLVRDGAVIVWRIPDFLPDHPTFRIVGAHTDSPTLRVHPAAYDTAAGSSPVGVEVY